MFQVRIPGSDGNFAQEFNDWGIIFPSFIRFKIGGIKVCQQ